MGKSAFEKRRDALAMILAASIMGLVDDPIGERLPEDCWLQMVQQANAILFLFSINRDKLEAGEALQTYGD